MRKLTTEEYIKEREHFFTLYGKYWDEICTINREENNIPDEEYTKEYEEQFEQRRQLIRESYKGYTDIYNTDFYCYLTKENIDVLVLEGANHEYLRKDLDLVGKKVQTTWDSGTYGILKGIAVCVDDIYYVIVDEQTKKLKWESAIGGIEPFDKEAHRGWCIVTNEKDYI